MGMPKIYIETSVVSYLTARPSRDLLIAARQEATREWWDLRGAIFHALISPLVVEEASASDPQAALKRLEICLKLQQLEISTECESLASRLISIGAIPSTEPEDALHIAIATLAQTQFIATWNFAHLVGPVAKYRLQSAIERLGYAPPILATPEELQETLP